MMLGCICTKLVPVYFIIYQSKFINLIVKLNKCCVYVRVCSRVVIKSITKYLVLLLF